MKHKLIVKYFFISTLLVAAALWLLGLPLGGVNAGPPEPTPSPAMDIRTRLQPYQTPGAEPSQSDGRLFEQAPLPSEVGEPPIDALTQQTFYAVADSIVLQGYPSQNLGRTRDMWAGYDEFLEPDGRIARSLVKFNITSLPSNATITQVTLRVYLVNSWDFPNTSRTIRAYRITSSWSESGVTWNNKPGYGESHGSRSIRHGAWGWYGFDVTNLAKAWHKGTYANYGIMLRGPEVSGYNASWRGFSTREGPYRPQLVVEYVRGDIPQPPSNLTATPVSQTQINLSWRDNSNNESGFKIERSPNGTTGWTQIATVGANVTTYANTGLTCNTTYYYRVRAYNASGNSAYSNLANATTFPCSQPPAAPSNLVATPVSQTQINLSWRDNSNNETGFKIERSPNGTTGWTQIATVGANVTTYPDTGRTCGTTYYYHVRAYNASGNSAYSNLANATTSDCSYSIYLPIILNNAGPPSGSRPVDGHWTGTTNLGQPMSFDVSSGGTAWSNFKLKTTFSVGGCSGTLETTVFGPGTITNNQFSYSGSTFSFSGQFTSSTTASGTYAFANHLIPGCGNFSQSGTWTANWP